MKREHLDGATQPGGLLQNVAPAKLSALEDETNDELLAVLGYKVRSSDMEIVAQKLQQLEMAIGGSAAQDDALLNHLATDTVHYNPSDLSNWLESMLSELTTTTPPPLPPAAYRNSPFLVDPVETADAIRPRDPKRMKTSCAGGSEALSARPVVMMDSQEAGIRLVHTLMACAEAVQQENYKVADVLVKQISMLASSQGGAMRKVAGYFAESLARRIYHLNPQQDWSLDSAFGDILQMHFYESCPYLKFAHFTANQAILEAFVGCRRVHVIDFSMKQGMQWPALMQALALRPGGPPSFRLTGIGPPQPDNTDALQQVGWKLAQLADTIHVDFEYRGFVANSLADLEPYMLNSPSSSCEEPEVVAFNSVFELHRLLAGPGALDKVLATVRALNPRILTVVEQEANHNAGSFVERFTEALHFYSTMFDSLEGEQDQFLSEVYLGRQIYNVVACEGEERTERHESLCQWRGRMDVAGFEPVHLGSNAFKQASMLLALFAGGEGYRVEEKEGCLTLGWHTRPLIATSAWRVTGSGQSLSDDR